MSSELVGRTMAVMSSNMQKAWYVNFTATQNCWKFISFSFIAKGQPDPMKRRSIMCVDQNEMALPDTRCTNETKPQDTATCGANLPYCNSDDNNSESNMI